MITNPFKNYRKNTSKIIPFALQVRVDDENKGMWTYRNLGISEGPTVGGDTFSIYGEDLTSKCIRNFYYSYCVLKLPT